MSKHLNVLSALFLGTGLMGTIGILVCLAIFSTGTLILNAVAAQDPQVPAEIVWIPAGFGLVLSALISLTVIPDFIAAYGLIKRRRWSRIVALAVGILSLPMFPLGTAAGIYAIWIFLQNETEAALSGPVSAGAGV